jgi:ribA/ribD-fused uncharacterized protein
MDLEFKVMSIEEAELRNAILGFNGEERFLSNFSFSKVEMYGIVFPSVEHAFAAAKIDPNDPRHTINPYAQMRAISALNSPGKAKQAGRRALMRPDWDEKKPQMVCELVRRKFADPDLRAKLAATGDRPLIELNDWNDRIWGMVEKNGSLTGKNLLGEILMKIRSEILKLE